MTADGLENIATHGRLTGAVTLNSVGWALSAVNNQPPPRILTSTIRHSASTSSLKGGEREGHGDGEGASLNKFSDRDVKDHTSQARDSCGSSVPVPSSSWLSSPPTCPAPVPGKDMVQQANGNPENSNPSSLTAPNRGQAVETVGPTAKEQEQTYDDDCEEYDDLSLLREEREQEGEDVWLLLGLPWREGFVAMLVNDEMPTSLEEGAPASIRGGEKASAEHIGERRHTWKRVWCVVQDSALALFDHKCAAEVAPHPTQQPILMCLLVRRVPLVLYSPLDRQSPSSTGETSVQSRWSRGM